MGQRQTAKGRRILYRLPRELREDELKWARKRARQASLSLPTWLRRVSETLDRNSDYERAETTSRVPDEASRER